jgi:hypothetical protein
LRVLGFRLFDVGGFWKWKGLLKREGMLKGKWIAEGKVLEEDCWRGKMNWREDCWRGKRNCWRRIAEGELLKGHC